MRLVLSGLLMVSFLTSVSYGGYCTENYSCSTTCYRRKRYTTACGFLGWDRCIRYKSEAYSCTGTCSRQVCCIGYQGSKCTTPICFDSTTCPNGGTCRAPDTCSCAIGFGGDQCSDINECLNSNGGCQHDCVNDQGSFHCQCKPGYVFASDNKSCVVFSKPGIGQCQLRSELVGPCDVGEDCVEDRNGPICRKDNATNIVVYVLSGVIAVFLILAVAGLLVYIMRSRYKVNNVNIWYVDVAKSSARTKCQWIKEDEEL